MLNVLNMTEFIQPLPLRSTDACCFCVSWCLTFMVNIRCLLCLCFDGLSANEWLVMCDIVGRIV